MKNSFVTRTTMTKPLSPAAQKVRHVAICAGPELEGRIAAALRAAACLEVSSNFDGTLYETGEDEFRAFLHVVTAELEAQ